jgi:chromosome segregation protein
LSALAERLRGAGGLARERWSNLTAEPGPPRPGRDPEELEREAATLGAEEAVLAERLESARAQLGTAASHRAGCEAELAEAERLLAARAREQAERAEHLAALRGQVAAAHSRAAAAEDEAARLSDALAQARSRASSAQADHDSYRDLAAGRHDDRARLAAEHELAAAVLADCSARVADRRARERQVSAELAGLRARSEALQEGLRALQADADAPAALAADPRCAGEVLGSVAALLTVADGAQEAITAALGAAADAVAVASLGAAVAVLQRLKDTDGGSTGLLIAGDWAPPESAARLDGELPPGVVPAVDLVKGPDALSAALDDLLAGVVVAEDLGQARDVLQAHPALRVVTRDGDLIGARWAHGGSVRPPSKLAMRVAAEEAATALRGIERACEEATAALAEAMADEDRARKSVALALAASQAADNTAAEVSGQLGRLGGAARAAAEEAARLETAITSAHAQREQDLAALSQLSVQLAAAEAGQDGGGATGATAPQPQATGLDRDSIAKQADAARDAETEARLEVRTAEERLRAIAGRAEALAAAAVSERRAAEAALTRQRLRERRAAVASAVARGAEMALDRIAASLALAMAEREAAQVASQGRAGALKEVRAQVRALAAELDTVVDTAHGAQIARAERRMRLEQLAARAAEEFGVDAAALAAEYGPSVPVPASPGEAEPHAAEPPRPAPYVRAVQEKRAAAAQRQLDQLGKVNPLALEEYAALEERHAFLARQVDDLKKTRRDLLTVIKEVDDRVQQVFASAFEDTAAEFVRIFAQLFPGGEGRLVLTDPDDMLATGIDVEARPPGKKVKRLSLLSGGERSLTAIAYLLAIFKARPSPFYVLDEVEAALDDTNLQRLLHIFEELRGCSQLILVTHQKRTMEAADALYGITMQGDGVSAVVSQRIREPERA